MMMEDDTGDALAPRDAKCTRVASHRRVRGMARRYLQQCLLRCMIVFWIVLKEEKIIMMTASTYMSDFFTREVFRV